jgi:OOP family OmpA-OmpF porin
MNKISRALIGLIMAAAALPAFSQETEMRPYGTVAYDTVFADDARKSETGTGYSFGVGKALNKYWGLEFGAFYDQFKKQLGGDDWREYGGKIDGLFFYSRNPRFSPYVALGVGGMENDRKTSGDKSFDVFGDAGIGFFKYFTVGSLDMGIRGDARYRWVNAKDIPGIGSFSEPVVKVGLVFPFGKRPSSKAAVGPGGSTAPDSGAYGSAGAGKKGGGDAEGVLDDQNRSFDSVHFEFDRSDLTDYAKAILDNAAGAINGLSQKYPSLKVDLSGHTDWIGTEGYNQALSERRADTVKKYLTRKGVDANRITTHAYGETKPVAPNDTTEGRALNRRVEVKTDAPK